MDKQVGRGGTSLQEANHRGCAAGWGRIFTTGVTISIDLLERGRTSHFRIFWGKTVLHNYG